MYLEPFYEGRDLAADQFDRPDVAMQKMLGHHPVAARLVQGTQLLDRLLDGPDDHRVALVGEELLAVVAFAFPPREARGVIDDVRTGLADDPAGHHRERQGRPGPA